MEHETMGFFGRLTMALLLPLRVLFDGRLAGLVARALRGDTPALPAAPPPAPVPPETPAAPAVDLDAVEEMGALHLLALLQREARLVDFLMEDVSSYSDAEVGAAVRVVHEGGRRVLKEHVTLEPVRSEAEESTITVEEGFDATATRLTGNVTGKPPWKGKLAHKGWRVKESRMPRRQAHEPVRVIQPAEVELP